MGGRQVRADHRLGPALLVGGQALSQVWLFLTLPMLGGLVAGILFRLKALEATPAPEFKEKRETVAA